MSSLYSKPPVGNPVVLAVDPGKCRELSEGLEVEGLSASYVGAGGAFGFLRRDVLSGISFSVAPGQVVWLTGQNGSGKSTLLRAIVDPRLKTRGQVRVGGVPLRPGQTAYAPQTPSASLSPWNSVRKEIALALRIAKRPRREWKDVGARLIREFGMDVPLDRRVEALSGGQRVRVAMLRALAVEAPALAILDEPLEGLDAIGRRSVLLAVRLLADRGVPVIITSHLSDDIAQIADLHLHLSGKPAVLTEVPLEPAEDIQPVPVPQAELDDRVETRSRKWRLEGGALGLVGLALGILSWAAAAAGVGNPGLLPPPTSVGKSMLALAVNTALAPHLLTTLSRALGCFIVANILAIPVGVLLGYNQRIFSLISPWLSIGRALPVFALAGPAIGVLPNRPEWQRLLLIFLTLFLLTVQSTSVTAAMAPRRRVDCARVFGASHWFCLTRIMPFESIAGAFAGLEVGLPLAMIVTLVVETFLIPDKGLGLYIFNHLMDADLSLLFAHILWPAVVAAIALAGVRSLSRRFRFDL